MNSELLISLSLGAVLLLVAGCKERRIAEPASSALSVGLPPDLRKMQGIWHSDEQVPYTCRIQFDGYTVRLDYFNPGGEARRKRNICIKKIDPDKKRLELYSGTNPWFYAFEEKSGGLELSIFDDEQGGWLQVRVKKADLQMARSKT